MPYIKTSTYLGYNYDKISKICHTHDEPVFITKDGHMDLAVMSIETYEKLVGKEELHGLLQEGLNDVAENRVRSFDEVIKEIEEKYRRK